jgi:proteasome lid subunit RPN8/RPN11
LRSLIAVRIAREQYDALIEHAREETPNECCGYMSLTEGAVVEVFRAENAYESPRFGFQLGKDDLVPMTNLEEDFDVAIYHSHPRSEAAPSQQDRNEMKHWPGYLQVIVSVTHEPPVRAWWIEESGVTEEPVELA